jgi:glycine/D-amino acid oxidase-like deaminating enzyme
MKMQLEGDGHLYIDFGELPEKDILIAPYGELGIQQAGYVDVPIFLHAIRTHLQALGSYLEADFQYKDIPLATDVTYQNIRAAKLVFCEGPQAANNPFFNHLPFRLVKGEVLTVQLPQAIQHIYARNAFIVPRQHGQAYMGTTYDWDHLDILPTSLAKQEVENKVRKFFVMPYQFISQQAGIRPATFDRRPFIGFYTQYPQLAILNGLGSKGVSLAPYLVGEFVKHLLYAKELPLGVR